MNLIALHFVNLFSAGILAGIEIAIHYGLRVPEFLKRPVEDPAASGARAQIARTGAYLFCACGCFRSCCSDS